MVPQQRGTTTSDPVGVIMIEYDYYGVGLRRQSPDRLRDHAISRIHLHLPKVLPWHDRGVQ